MKGNLTCIHRSVNDIDPEFITLIRLIEQELGYELIANSLVRCPECNKAVGGESHSAHCKESHISNLACAGDFQVNAESCWQIINKAIEKGIKRIGIDRKSGEQGFIHLDTAKCDDGYIQNRIWTY